MKQDTIDVLKQAFIRDFAHTELGNLPGMNSLGTLRQKRIIHALRDLGDNFRGLFDVFSKEIDYYIEWDRLDPPPQLDHDITFFSMFKCNADVYIGPHLEPAFSAGATYKNHANGEILLISNHQRLVPIDNKKHIGNFTKCN